MLFHEFSPEDHVSHDHLGRSIDRYVELSKFRPHLVDFYSYTGRSLVDPEPLIRMLFMDIALASDLSDGFAKKCI